MRRIFAVFLGIMIVAAIGCGGVKKQTKAETPPPTQDKPDTSDKTQKKPVPVVVGRSAVEGVSHMAFKYEAEKESALLYVSASTDPSSEPAKTEIEAAYFRVFSLNADDAKKLDAEQYTPSAVAYALAAPKVVDSKSLAKDASKPVTIALSLSDKEGEPMSIPMTAPDAAADHWRIDKALGDTKLDVFATDFEIAVTGETNLKDEYTFGKLPFPGLAIVTAEELKDGKVNPKDAKEVKVIALDKKKPGPLEGVFIASSQPQSIKTRGCYLQVQIGAQWTEFHIVKGNKIDTTEAKDDLAKVPDGDYKTVNVGCRSVVSSKLPGTSGEVMMYTITEFKTKFPGMVKISGGDAEKPAEEKKS